MDLDAMDADEYPGKFDQVGRKHLKILRAITPELFNQYLSEKGVRSFCIQCGKQCLFVPHTIVHMGDQEAEVYDDTDDLTFVTPTPNPGGPFRYQTAIYEVNCGHCGFISNYHVRFVVAWAIKKGVIDLESC